MKTGRIAAAVALVLALVAGTATAQTLAQPYVPQPMAAGPTMAAYAPSGYYVVAADPATTENAAPPAGAAKAEEKKDEEKKDEEEKKEDEEKEWRLFQSPCLEANRIDVHGWLDQGFTWNPQSPGNSSNGPVGYNDRSNEYMFNQLYLVMERVTKTDDCCWDVGGRIDLLYGEDHRFVEASGLDNELNSGHLYGLAIPQMYLDLAYDKWIFRTGHFLYPNGNEAVTAPDNFFYSHSYTFLYGQPTTYSGSEVRYKFNDHFTAFGGWDTGWNDWNSPNGKIGGFGGFNWTSSDEKTTLAFVLSFNNQQPTGVSSTRTHYDLVLTHKLSDKLTYQFEQNLGNDSFVEASGTSGTWYSFVNYLTYQLNDKWALGARWEWMRDEEGVILPPTAPFAATAGFPGTPGLWNDISLGVNFKPNKNVIFRSEVRYDWETGLVPGATAPFNDNTKDNQWLWGNDLIVKF